jgi:RND family efflux transporter MFP subunit
MKQRIIKFLIGCFVVLIAIAAYKFYETHEEELARAAELAAGPLIHTAKVLPSPGDHVIELVGETRPYQEATLYAKVSGYLKSVKVDKGDIVKQGQVLAIIESPETDQAYEGALANAKNKQAIDGRIMSLLGRQLVSQQEADQAKADADVASAQLHSAEVLKSYETLRAPFNGTITARYADPGALVQNATSSQASALPVVTVSQIDRLRVDVFVDQHDAAFVARDQDVEITLNDQPDFKLNGHVSRVSGELDARTKMLLTEIDIMNKNPRIVAGSFVKVALRIKSPPYLQAPVEALLLKDDKTYLTTVTPDNRIKLQLVKIVGNDGHLLWIQSGVETGTTVALSVGDTVPDGGKVRPTDEAKVAPQATGKLTGANK